MYQVIIQRISLAVFIIIKHWKSIAHQKLKLSLIWSCGRVCYNFKIMFVMFTQWDTIH